MTAAEPRPADATPPPGAELEIVDGWLVENLRQHTCAGDGPEANGAHESHCGLEPLMDVATLAGLFDVLTEAGLPVNRPEQLRARLRLVAGAPAVDAPEPTNDVPWTLP